VPFSPSPEDLLDIFDLSLVYAQHLSAVKVQDRLDPGQVYSRS